MATVIGCIVILVVGLVITAHTSKWADAAKRAENQQMAEDWKKIMERKDK